MEAVASAWIRRCDVCSGPQGVKQAAPGCRVVAITFRSPIQPARVEGPHLGIIYAEWPDILFWEPGGPHMPLPPEHTILKDYPVRCERLSEDWPRAALAFGRDFPPRRSEPHPTAAWVAPDGSFYPCHWLEHDRLAYRLAAARYDSPDGPRRLEQSGWLRLEHDGTVVGPARGRPLSQAQLDVLFTLLQTAEGTYRANIAEELELSRIAERLRSGGRPANS
jgi:hypothetical protein